MRIKEGAKAARLRLGRFRAKVLYEKNIGEERSHSTEVRKERSETKKEVRRKSTDKESMNKGCEEQRICE